MDRRTPTIIGLSLGSRYVGTAVMRGNELLDWRIKVIRARGAGERKANLRRILSRVVDAYHPICLALKGIHPSRSSQFIDWIVDEIQRFAVERKLHLEEYPLSVLKQTILKTKKGGKREMAEALATEYPVLYNILHRQDHGRSSYRLRVFEAVAVAKVCAKIFMS